MRAFTSILWKEAKGLKPFFVFMIVFFIVGLLATQFSDFMDENSFWNSLWGFNDSNIQLHFVFAILLLIIAFIGTLGILPREKEEGSLAFLEGLPLKRSTIYFAKWLIVTLVVSTFSLLLFVELLVYEWLSIESDSPATPWRHVLTFYLLCQFLCVFFVTVLFPLSLLRLWSLLFIILYFIIVYILIGIQIPYATTLSPFELIQPPFDIEAPWIIPWERLCIYTLVGMIAYFFGLWLFSRIPATAVKQDKPFHKTVGGWITFIVAGGFGLLIILSVILTNMAAQAENEKQLGADSQIKNAKTKHFEFLYRVDLSDRIAPLIEEADSIYYEVADLLQAEENNSRIVVDLLRPLASHNAGQAHWNKIRMSYPDTYTLEEARAVFGHEVTHVIIDRSTNSRLTSLYSSQWFHEGLASYIEFTLFRKTKSSEDYQRWLALAASWDEAKFLDFVNPSNGSDPHLVYPAGLEAIQALVDVYGEEALPKLLKGIGRKNAPKKLSGMQFWTDSFLAAGLDLERVRAQFRKRLNNLEKKHKAMCDKLPEITEGTAKKVGAQLIITPKLPKNWRKNAPPNAQLICRIRPTKNAPKYQWRYAKLSQEKTFVRNASEFTSPNIGFQVGWIVKTWTPDPIFGEWVNIDLDQQE